MNSYERTLLQCMSHDERVTLITAENRGHLRNLPPLIQGRFFDVGIAEMTMIGMAAGLALRGKTVITHALATFLTLRAFEFLRTDVGIGRLPVISVGMVPGFLSDGNGPTHQAIEDVSLMRSIPGMNVFCPSDSQELSTALPEIIASRSPWYIRYIDREATTDADNFCLGEARMVFGNVAATTDVAILTYGFLRDEVVEAARRLSNADVSTSVTSFHTLEPFDADALTMLASRSALLVVIEDHLQTGGLYSKAAEVLCDAQNQTPLVGINLGKQWFKPGRLNEVLEYEGFTAKQLASRVQQLLSERVVHG